MVNLDLKHDSTSIQLTFAKIQILKSDYTVDEFHKEVQVDLKSWAPQTVLPYKEFR